MIQKEGTRRPRFGANESFGILLGGVIVARGTFTQIEMNVLDPCLQGHHDLYLLNYAS